MTLQTILTQGREELDKNQRLFLNGKLHSTQFNKWFEQYQASILAGVREMIRNMPKRNLGTLQYEEKYVRWNSFGKDDGIDDLLAALSMGDKKPS